MSYAGVARTDSEREQALMLAAASFFRRVTVRMLRECPYGGHMVRILNPGLVGFATAKYRRWW